MTNETGQVIYKTSTPFRLRTRMTTLYKVILNEDLDDMLDSFEAIRQDQVACDQSFEDAASWRGDEDGPVYSPQRILGVGVLCIVVWQHWLMRLQDEADAHGTRWSVIQMGHRFLDSLGEYACVLGSPNI